MLKVQEYIRTAKDSPAVCNAVLLDESGLDVLPERLTGDIQQPATVCNGDYLLEVNKIRRRYQISYNPCHVGVILRQLATV